jgi:oxygen-independent coproporphyrinogen-3 oxidase
MDSLSIYLHVPFCQHRCGYCDFNTYAGIDYLIPRYIDALSKEISLFANKDFSSINYEVHTIYFGGGTPSMLPPKMIEKVLTVINKAFTVSENCEITMEINPGTIKKKELKELHLLGVNRLSIGVQSTDPNELRILERLHGYPETYRTFMDANNLGFENISFDLIFGLPDQKKEIWEKSLLDLLKLMPDHLSLYSLTVEEGTPLALKVNNGLVSRPDPDLAADLYDLAREILGGSGYIQYEISNWAKVGSNGLPMVSKHNLQYWLNNPYVGFGAGAHGFVAGCRTINEANPFKYASRLEALDIPRFPTTPATIACTPISTQIEIEDTMIMGLRLLREGVSVDRFLDRFGVDMRDVYSREIIKLINKGLLEWTGEKGENLVLTEPAYFLANQVFLEFISV